ncbi:methyltransferase domain-containing protein [Spirillospora sp. NBC_00431]
MASTSGEVREGGRLEGHPDYMLGTSDSEVEHLVAQAEAYTPAARSLIGKLDIQPDWKVADMGCGALGILHLLAERVGPRGEVHGVDREERMLEVARRLLDERSLQRVRLLKADVNATGLPRRSFDLVHARTVLVNIAAVEPVIEEMASLVRAGGLLALQEPDGSSWVCEPRHPAWDALRDLFGERYRKKGCDPDIGRRLPALLRAAGLEDVRIDVQPTSVTQPGDWHHLQLPTFIELIRESVISLGLCPADELDRMVKELNEHLRKPGTVTYCPLWQAWGKVRPSLS